MASKITPVFAFASLAAENFAQANNISLPTGFKGSGKKIVGSITVKDLKKFVSTGPVKKLLTEDLGKEFEMAVCMCLDIPYDGDFKYSLVKAEELSAKLCLLKDHLPADTKFKHTAANQGRYDLTSVDEKVKFHIKTTKKHGMEAPQVIGQPSAKTFIKHFDLDPNSSKDDLKRFIYENMKQIIKEEMKYLFDEPIIYYDKLENSIKIIKLIKEVDLENVDITYANDKKLEEWNNSLTIKIKNTKIAEQQFHSTRSNLVFRFNFKTLFKIFPENFQITKIY
jgi:hypothetical protein